jgi:hypothetical protein
MAIANEANSDAAEELMANHPLITGARVVMNHSRWFLLLTILPVLTVWRRRGRRAGLIEP